jgi:MinD superfamily P-loop ATPase containing an inserted ferredoxin domain
MKILYFTGTGNSLFVAKSFDAELFSIPQMEQQGTYEFSDDSVGLVFPCYMFDVPPVVKEFLRKAKIDAEYKFAIFTYGGTMMSAPYRMKKFLSKIGTEFNYINGVEMVDNYIPMFEQSEQIEKLPSKDVNGNLKKILEDVENRVWYFPLPKVKDQISVGMMQPFKRVIMGKKFSRRFKISEGCNQCGTCARVCPSGNISVGDHVQFHDRCETCLACIHLCPQNAIHLKKEKSSARSMNTNVSLAEIIRSNERPK